MVKEQFGKIEVRKSEFPPRDLWVVPTANGPLVTSVFGPNYFDQNVQAMQKDYSHPQTGEKMIFREPTTQESLEACAYRFSEMAKPEILDSRWLQLGRLVKTSNGIFTNTSETNQKELDRMLNSATKVEGIYFIGDKKVFIPYDTFEEGVLCADDFARTTLARGLEHTTENVAPNFAVIAGNYPNVVHPFWWKENVSSPVERLSALDSYNRCLICFGNCGWYYNYGCSFGVKK